MCILLFAIGCAGFWDSSFDERIQASAEVISETPEKGGEGVSLSNKSVEAVSVHVGGYMADRIRATAPGLLLGLRHNVRESL